MFKNGPQNFALQLVLGAFPQPYPRGKFFKRLFFTKNKTIFPLTFCDTNCMYLTQIFPKQNFGKSKHNKKTFIKGQRADFF